MKKIFLGLVFLSSSSTFASESKIICSHKTPDQHDSTGTAVLYDREEKALNSMNNKIKIAEAEGFTKVSAPMGVLAHGGDTISFCVTVTKP